MSERAYMREALRLAERAMRLGEGGPFGAVVVREGEVIARAWNRVISSADPTAHAEVLAIRQAARHLGHFHLEGCQLYSSCQPCPMCLGAAYWAHIERIYYAASGESATQAGFSDESILAELRAPPADRRIPATVLLQREGIEVFRRYQALAEKTNY